METNPIVKEIVIDGEPERVWNAITNKDEMKKWYFDLIEFKPEVGFEFQFEGKGREGASYLHLCKITEVIPGKKLSYSWRYDGYSGNSYVTFEVFKEENKTRLRLTHEGIESFGTDNPDFAKENFDDGWNQIIGKSLIEYLESDNK
jgi:uncharacterized protein YndB with AHSA1/START domain